MPLILRWQYGVAVGIGFVFSFLVARAGLKNGLTLISMLVIVGSLWTLGFPPIGFLVSIGGWITFLLTLCISGGLALVVGHLNRSRPSRQAR
jgi:hypothetical protein